MRPILHCWSWRILICFHILPIWPLLIRSGVGSFESIIPINYQFINSTDDCATTVANLKFTKLFIIPPVCLTSSTCWTIILIKSNRHHFIPSIKPIRSICIIQRLLLWMIKTLESNTGWLLWVSLHRRWWLRILIFRSTILKAKDLMSIWFFGKMNQTRWEPRCSICLLQTLLMDTVVHWSTCPRSLCLLSKNLREWPVYPTRTRSLLWEMLENKFLCWFWLLIWFTVLTKNLLLDLIWSLMRSLQSIFILKIFHDGNLIILVA